jgi:uncharacterized protein (DUF111 family)
VHDIRALVAAANVPDTVRERADRVFTAIAEQEAEIHGTTAERVHCGAIQLGDGFVRAAHGVLPVPAPATLKLLEGLRVRPGPDGAGELVTPTGAALVRVLAAGPAPEEYVPVRSGFGAGTKDFAGRANALRIVLADRVATAGQGTESLVGLAADIDDMSPEYLAAAADELRAAGALDVVLLPTIMKKGRAGIRLEVLAQPQAARELESAIFAHTTTIGVRRVVADRAALAREERIVDVDGQRVRAKVVVTPDGTRRAKPEFEDVRRAAAALGVPPREVLDRVTAELSKS